VPDILVPSIGLILYSRICIPKIVITTNHISYFKGTIDTKGEDSSYKDCAEHRLGGYHTVEKVVNKNPLTGQHQHKYREEAARQKTFYRHSKLLKRW
jgi:hypothetical protein